MIEVLVSAAVLAMLVVLLSQMFGAVSRTWLGGQSRANNFTKARALLDLLARDLQAGVFRDDLAAFPNSKAAFYTRCAGIPATAGGAVREVSLVHYEIDAGSPHGRLKRADLAIPWDGAAGLISFGETDELPRLTEAAPRETASGVVGFYVFFLLADGTVSPAFSANPSNPARVAGVALAVVDDQAMNRMTEAQVVQLRAELAAAAAVSRSVKAEWEDYLRTEMDWAAYPKDLAQGLMVFERYVPLPEH